MTLASDSPYATTSAGCTKQTVCMHILALVVATSRDVDGQCGKFADGCAVPDDFPLKEEFTPACDSHTVCYDCGFKFDVSKSKCNDAFLNNMKSICSSRPEVSQCNATAEIYYNGVQMVGGPKYETTPKNYCTQSWVRSCLP